jgi:hypothetical protein
MATALVFVAWSSISIVDTPVTAAVVPSCTSASVEVSDYNTLVGTGHVNDLFWIKNVGRRACTLHGYVRAAFIGVYGAGTPYKDSHTLTIREGHSYGRDGNDVGGLKKGLVIPTVTLKPDGSGASFWLAGTDIQAGNPPDRCITSYKMLAWLPGSSTSIVVKPLRANGFFWCGGFVAHPIVPGKSGSDPAVRLSYYFGVPG